jgi:hypothetical protein
VEARDRIRIVKMQAEKPVTCDQEPQRHDSAVALLALGAILFCVAVAGIFINRKNVIVLLMAIELMLLAVNIELRRVLALSGRLRRAGVRVLHPDRGRGRGRDRPGDPGRAVPQRGARSTSPKSIR